MDSFIDFDNAEFPNDKWVTIVQNAKDEFEIDGAMAAYSTFKTFELDATMTDERAEYILKSIPEGEFIMRIKFIREKDDNDWVVEDKYDPIRNTKGTVITISKNTKPGLLIGVESPYFKNAYPVTAIAYGLYLVQEPDPDNLEPLRVGKLNCVAQRVMEFYNASVRGFGLTQVRSNKIHSWEAEVHDTGASIDDVADLEKTLKHPIILKDITGETIFNSGKYQANRAKQIQLIYHNAHCWSQDLFFPRTRNVTFYKDDIWSAIKQAVQDVPVAV